jgi:hypothetical protein
MLLHVLLLSSYQVYPRTRETYRKKEVLPRVEEEGYENDSTKKDGSPKDNSENFLLIDR